MKKIAGVSELKFLLILGIVLIHCEIISEYPTSALNANFGIQLCHFISGTICYPCVPCFFVISGYLFFRDVSKFNSNIYLQKIKQRSSTLLLPYIIWCTICCFLLYIKHRYLHMSGLNIFLDDGSINWPNLFAGYWSIPEAGNMPYAMAFWFIRNLMVFELFSPVVWFGTLSLLGVCCYVGLRRLWPKLLSILTGGR